MFLAPGPHILCFSSITLVSVSTQMLMTLSFQPLHQLVTTPTYSQSGCNGLNSGPLKYAHLELRIDLLWNKGLCRCNEGQDLEMRSSWMRVGPKSNDRWQKRRRHLQASGEGHAKARHKLASCVYEPRNTGSYWQPPEARRETWKEFSLRTYQRNSPCQHLNLGFLDSQTLKE